jgi:hypothetical protein
LDVARDVEIEVPPEPVDGDGELRVEAHSVERVERLDDAEPDGVFRQEELPAAAADRQHLVVPPSAGAISQPAVEKLGLYLVRGGTGTWVRVSGGSAERAVWPERGGTCERCHRTREGPPG